MGFMLSRTAVLRRSPALSSECPHRIQTLQTKKLQSLIQDAMQNVPYLREVYRDAGISAADISTPADLVRLPAVTKQALRSVALEERLNQRFHPKELLTEQSGGSTGEPFRVFMEKSYTRQKNLRFLRGLLDAGYRPGQRMMLVTDRSAESGRANFGWHYCALSRPTEDIAEDFLRVSPAILYGCATPLRLLGDYLIENQITFTPPRLVITTAEALDRRARSALQAAFGSPLADFYGLTEMGLVAWQRPHGNQYIMAHDSILTEFVTDASGQGRYRMLMTNLDLRAMPLIRFDCGDIAMLNEQDNGQGLIDIDGRAIDVILTPAGKKISPYRITTALEEVRSLRRYKITQYDLDSLHVAIETEDSDGGETTTRVKSALTAVLGPDVRIELECSDQLVPQGTRKFRPVESRLTEHS